MPIIEPKPQIVTCKTCGVRHEEALYSTTPVPGHWCSLECYQQSSRPWGVEWKLGDPCNQPFAAHEGFDGEA